MNRDDIGLMLIQTCSFDILYRKYLYLIDTSKQPLQAVSYSMLLLVTTVIAMYSNVPVSIYVHILGAIFSIFLFIYTSIICKVCPF